MLEKPNPCTEKGFRDLLILCLLYDTGARVSELLDLTVGDVHFDSMRVYNLRGKGINPERYRFQQNSGSA